MIDHPDTLGGPAFDPGMFTPSGRGLARFCKGGAPSMTKQQKENERKQGEMLDYQLAQSKKPQAMPHIPVPPPTPPSAPPPSQTSADVTNAEQNARKQAGKRKGVQSTLLAGNTGGYQPLGGGQTLLG